MEYAPRCRFQYNVSHKKLLLPHQGFLNFFSIADSHLSPHQEHDLSATVQ